RGGAPIRRWRRALSSAPLRPGVHVLVAGASPWMGERAVVVHLAALPTGRDRVLPARRLQEAIEARILLLAGARHGRQFLLLVVVVAVVLEVAAPVRRGEEVNLVG